MKRTLAAFCVMILMIVTAFPGVYSAEPADQPDITGTWYPQNAKQGDMEVNAAYLFLMGMSMTITLNPDGTAVVAVNGSNLEGNEGTWSFDGTSGTIETVNVIPFTYDGTYITLEQDGMSMVLGREEPVMEMYSPAPPVADAQAADYEGAWQCCTVLYSGMEMPAKMMGIQLDLDIHGTDVGLYEEKLDLNNDFAVEEAADHALQGELLEDGSFRIALEGNEILSSLLMAGSELVLTLREDGTVIALVPEYYEYLDEMQEGMDIEEMEDMLRLSLVFERTDGTDPPTSEEQTPQEMPENKESDGADPAEAPQESSANQESVGTNLLVNPDWENGIEGWEIQAENETGTYQNQEKLFSSIRQDIPMERIPEAKSLRLAGDIALAPEDPSQVCIRLGMAFYDAAGTILDSRLEAEEGAELTRHEIQMDIPQGTASVRVLLEIWKDGTVNSFNFADLSLEAVQEPFSGGGF